MSGARVAALAALTVGLIAGFAPAVRAEAKLLQICQRLLGDDTTCEAVTAWGVDKVADTPTLQAPQNAAATYTITVTEGETHYALGLSTVLTLTGLMPEGTRVRGLVASIQKGDGQGHYATVASGGFGDTTTLCSCPFVDSGELEVTVRTIQGDLIPNVEGSVMEALGYGEDVQVEIGAAYDLSNAAIRPGDQVRISTCVNYAPADAPDDAVCIAEGGETRSVKACTPFDFDAYATPTLAEVAVDEHLGLPTDGLLKMGKFTARPLSGPVTPGGSRVVTPGASEAVTWSVAPTGVPGSTSVIQVDGTVTCQPVEDCTRVSGNMCLGTLDNRVDVRVGDGSTVSD
ncbi:MAG: hypothetical protein KC635_28275, partial [Myxococcales bacterium]|nr:hypothetical protein [Myxococcales bacterium]